MTLRISLRDGEPVIVNGAVLRARGRTQFQVENEATILRGRDVMKPEEATSPAKRLYFACMMAYIDPQDLERHRQALLAGLEGLIGALASREAKSVCVRFAEKVACGKFYAALADCRWLIAYESEAMARIGGGGGSAPVPASAMPASSMISGRAGETGSVSSRPAV